MKSELSHLLKENESPSELTDKKQNLIVFGSTDCEIKLKIDGIKTLSKARMIKLTNSVVQMRNSIK